MVLTKYLLPGVLQQPGQLGLLSLSLLHHVPQVIGCLLHGLLLVNLLVDGSLQVGDLLAEQLPQLLSWKIINYANEVM